MTMPALPPALRTLALAAACLVPLAAAVGPEELMLHLPLDESGGSVAIDASGRGHHGALLPNARFDPAGGRLAGAVWIDAASTTLYQLKINFQPPGVAVPAGYVADSGEPYGDRGNGFVYGWNVPTTEYRERGVDPDPRRDTLTHLRHNSRMGPPDRVWELALPNGRYDLDLACGDPSYTDQINDLLVESVTVVDPTPYVGNADRFRLTVEVTDGALTITQAPTGDNAKLQYLEITARPTADVGIDVADSGDINAGNVAERSVSLWFKADLPDSSVAKQVLFEEGGTARGLNLYLFAGRLYAGGWNVPTRESGWKGTFLSVPAPGDGGWHHVLLTLDGGDTVQPDALRLSLDGTEVASGPGSRLWSHAGDIGIGRMDQDSVFHDGAARGTGHAFAGRVDDVRIFARVVTPDELAELSDPPPAEPPPPPSASPALTHGVLTGVGSEWQRIEFGHTYTRAVVVATPAYGPGDLPAVVRVRAVDATGCEIRVQNPSDASLSGYSVHWLALEEGTYTQAEHGVALEAWRVASPLTANRSDWGAFQGYAPRGTYAQPVVLGGVMSANDPGWSSFAAIGARRDQPPGASSIQVSKHSGEDRGVRVAETLAVVVVEAGDGAIEGTAFRAGLGADSVAGVGNAPPYSYVLPGFEPGTALLATAGIDGADGGWPVLYGADPVAIGALRLAIDEDQVGDSERGHTSEQVAWLAFADPDAGGGDGGGDGGGAAAPQLRQGVAHGVGDQWITVPIPGAAYARPVIVATPVATRPPGPPGTRPPPLVARVRNAGASSFELRVQRPGGSVTGTTDVHWVAVDAGVYTAAEHGITLEAGRISVAAVGHDRDWDAAVPLPYRQAYTAPVVLGQVMSADDARWSVFWADDGRAGNPPDADGLRIGRHVAEDPDTARAPDLLGYVVVEAGSGLLADGRRWVARLSEDRISGVDDAPPYRLDLGLDFTGLNVFERILLGNRMPRIAVVASSAGMDGANGGWPVLWGDQPVDIGADLVDVAIDEDQLSDAERSHTSEQVGYLVIGPGSFALPE